MSKDTENFTVRIDGSKTSFNDSIVTGRQLLNAAGKRPIDEHIIFQN